MAAFLAVWCLSACEDAERDATRGGSVTPSAGEPDGPTAGASGPRPRPEGRTYVNPVHDHLAPDPAVMRDHDGTYYAYTTQSEYGGRLVHVPVLRSRDLVQWRFVGDALPAYPRWGGEEAWAPHVFRRADGRYVLYVSVRSETLGVMQVVAAVAERPEGPFVPPGGPLLEPTDETIDPFVLRTADGELFFYWSVDNTVRVRRLLEDGLRLTGPSEVVLVHIGEEGTGYDSVVEGAWVTEHEGGFYLFTSGDICCGEGAHYAVSASRSSSPMGSFERNPANPILSAGDDFFAPGHNSVATDDAGGDWIVYHAMHAGTTTYDRVMLIDRIRWVDGWPVVDGTGTPSADARPAPRVRGI
ncbi:MAG TPA: glycoside hydrolase family 43 protein [Actinomycetota bacterium]|nr:glycoside hydrolase family 43 protein [Actinomycetota bacterium]